MFDTLPSEFAAALEQTALARGHVGATIHYFAEIGSTNDEAARLAERGAAEGTTVIASSQTAGRGRFGRPWFSPPGAGLYVSPKTNPKNELHRRGPLAPVLPIGWSLPRSARHRRRRWSWP